MGSGTGPPDFLQNFIGKRFAPRGVPKPHRLLIYMGVLATLAANAMRPALPKLMLRVCLPPLLQTRLLGVRLGCGCELLLLGGFPKVGGAWLVVARLVVARIVLWRPYSLHHLSFVAHGGPWVVPVRLRAALVAIVLVRAPRRVAKVLVHGAVWVHLPQFAPAVGL